MASGATACLLKPIKRAELYNVLRHVAAQKEMAKSIEVASKDVVDHGRFR